jgi:D-lactate dehydrogenase
MRILFYSTRPYEEPFLQAMESSLHVFSLKTASLSVETASLASGYDAVSIFTSDDASAPVLDILHANGVRFIAIRATGFDNVDIVHANRLGISVANVPHYSPESIAEHAIALLLALNRKLVSANRQVHRYDFTLDTLVGSVLYGKTAGVIGTGRTGRAAVRILHGFGCKLLANDLYPDAAFGDKYEVQYTDLTTLIQSSDIITLHAPLNAQTKYLINGTTIGQMKRGVQLVNTSRGGLVNTDDLIEYLLDGHIGAYGMDVYEKEKGIFFHDLSQQPPDDPNLKILLSLPNVLITPHQAFATREALQTIVRIMMENINAWASGEPAPHMLHVAP